LTSTRFAPQLRANVVAVSATAVSLGSSAASLVVSDLKHSNWESLCRAFAATAGDAGPLQMESDA